MNKPFTVPMSPDQLPRQRLVSVVELPALPEGLDVLTDDETMPEALVERDRPGQSTFLVALEWAWSPMHNRLQGFSIEHHSSGYWILWSYFVDFVENDDNPWILSAVCPDPGLDERTAAIHLVTASLTDGRDNEYLDHFHWIADEGLLTPADMRVIAERVWPKGRKPDDGKPEPLVLEDQS